MKDHLKTKQRTNEKKILRKLTADKEDKELLQYILDKIPLLLAYVSSDQHYIYANRTYAKWYGLSKKDIIGKSVKDILNNESYKEIQKHIRSVLQGKEIVIENTIYNQKGQLQTLKEIYLPHFDKNKKVTAFLTMIEDITGKEQEEKAFHDWRSMQQAILDSIPSGVFWKDLNLNYLGGNRLWLDAIGMKSSEEVVGKSDYDLPWDKDHADAYRKDDKRILKSGIPEYGIVEPYIRIDGIYAWAKTNKVPLRNAEGKMIGILGTYEDITERKKAEEALQYRAEFERLITSTSTHLANLPPKEIDKGISQALQQIGQFAHVDRSYVFLFNQDGTTMDNTHEWCADGIQSHLKELKNIPTDAFQWSIQKIKKSKTVHIPCVADLPETANAEKKEFEREDIVSLIFVPIVSAGKAIGFLGFDSVREKKSWPEDIILLLKTVAELIANTLDRKRSEGILRESEKKFRELVELLPQTIFEIDLEANITFVNQYGLKMFGYTKNDFKQGINLKQLFPPNEFRRAVNNMQKILKGVEKPGHEYTAVKKDGSWLNVIAFSTPIFTGNQHTGWRGTVIDITERKQAEVKVQESEEKFRTLAERSPNMIFINREGKVIYANERCEEVIGYTRKELLSPDFNFITIIAPESRNLIWENYKQHMEGRDVDPYEYTLVTKNGEQADVIIATKLIDYEDRKAILGIVTDITERKRSEEDLRKSQERLELTLNSIGIGLWDHDMRTNQVIRSRHWAEMLGYKPNEIEENLEIWKKLIHPEDLPLVNKTAKKHEAGKTPFFKVEHRLKTKTGDWKWILNWGRIIERDATGKPIRALGTHIDISDRKHAEAAVEKANREWQNIFQAVGHPTIILDPRHELIAANRAVLEKSGKSEKELLGKKCYEVFHGKDRVPNKCPFKKMIHSGRIETAEMEMEAFQGTYLVSCTPVFDENGKIEKIIHIATEITKRKKAEEALQESEERFRSIFENAVMGLYRTTPDGQIAMANPALIRMLGYATFEELAKRNLEKLGYEPEYSRARYKERMEKEGKVIGLESTWIKHDGTTLYVSESASAIRDEEGNIRYYEGTVEDITERKKAEERIRQSLEEKEILLKEIHHRVKNNLQVIISLLNLQSAQIQDETALKAFQDSNRRIRSMAMVHEKLYQSEDFSTINFKEYVENMNLELFDAYRVSEKVELLQDIENIPLGISEAIPCGLILNELLTNALKHAFQKDQKGQIQVVFHRLKSGEYELMVQDNGIGIPESIDFNETKSLGLLLVRILSNQLNGKVELSREGGTVFQICF